MGLTSNDASQLPAPILDRMRHFDIEPPTPQQARRIVLRIYDEIVTEMQAGAETLSAEERDNAKHQTFRRRARYRHF